jgi:hypothetical protein
MGFGFFVHPKSIIQDYFDLIFFNISQTNFNLPYLNNLLKLFLRKIYFPFSWNSLKWHRNPLVYFLKNTHLFLISLH